MVRSGWGIGPLPNKLHSRNGSGNTQDKNSCCHTHTNWRTSHVASSNAVFELELQEGSGHGTTIGTKSVQLGASNGKSH
eukprot:1601329-Amphidinium_carterae.1